MDTEIFIELSRIMFIAVTVTGLARLLKQPAIIGYLVSGILAGPFFLNIISSTETLSAFSQIGVALLLFFVGLNLNPKVIREVGKVSLITGIGQIIFTAAVGFVIAKALGFPDMTSLYLSIALAFSSTIIIMKLLSDKKDLESLYGRISIGFLIVQDLVAIMILLAISSLGSGADLASLAIGTVIRGVICIAMLFVLTFYLLPPLTRAIAKSQEFLLMFSITWCLVIASVFYRLDFSIEAGALLAGVALSLTPYHLEISSRMKPLRDFFLILFFVMLGSQMVFSDILANILSIVLLSLFVLVGNPIIVMALMGLLGYTKRNGFLAGLTVAQISEFSLILLAMGASLGHIPKDIMSVATAVGLITFAGSTYMIIHSNSLYPLLSRYLSVFERRGRKVDEQGYARGRDHEIILFGYNRIGFDVLEALKKAKRRFLIIDYDPGVIATLSREGYDCRYGDANDSELLNEINFSNIRMVISTIPITDTNMLLIGKVREANRGAIIAVVSHQIDDAMSLYEKGATYVIMPHFLGGKHFSTMIERNRLSMSCFLKEKAAHMKNLAYRKRAGHEHPAYEGR